MDIFEMFPVVAGEGNGPQNLINVLILIGIFMGSLWIFAYAIGKVFSGLLWFKNEAPEKVKDLSTKIARDAKDIKGGYELKKKERQFQELRERIEMEELIRLQVRTELSSNEGPGVGDLVIALKNYLYQYQEENGALPETVLLDHNVSNLFAEAGVFRNKIFQGVNLVPTANIQGGLTWLAIE